MSKPIWAGRCMDCKREYARVGEEYIACGCCSGVRPVDLFVYPEVQGQPRMFKTQLCKCGAARDHQVDGILQESCWDCSEKALKQCSQSRLDSSLKFIDSEYRELWLAREALRHSNEGLRQQLDQAKADIRHLQSCGLNDCSECAKICARYRT